MKTNSKGIDRSIIPKQPGCYLFKDPRRNIIYIGKAKNLQKRVSSYFSKTHYGKTELLVAQIRDVETIVTNSEVEALILENNLIKKHQPKYNINLKDSKRYAYLLLTDERFPRLMLARRRVGEGKYFGPFVSAATRDYILETIRKRFKLRTCKKMPKKACLRYHIKICDAPCIENIDEKEYLEKIKNVEQVLKGKVKEVSARLEKEMKKASARQDYEHAIDLRNQREAIEWLKERQTMERQKKYDEDIVNYAVKEGKVYLILFNVHRGMLENKQEFEFDERDGVFEEFIVQYYSENEIPKELIVPKKLGDVVVEYLEQKKKGKVRVVVPKIGEKKQLLMLVKKNVEATFFGEEEKLLDMQKKLKLQERPSVIECFDISHLSGTSTVGSMVQFRNGRPDKNNYRRFKIRTVDGIDDFAAIAEVVRRRYTRLKNERGQMPNLIMIDGGKGQLHAALGELKKLELRIPTISIAKKFEEIYVPGLRIPLRLDKKSKALRLLQAIRDESHRFAINYNRLLRSKKMLKK